MCLLFFVLCCGHFFAEQTVLYLRIRLPAESLGHTDRQPLPVLSLLHSRIHLSQLLAVQPVRVGQHPRIRVCRAEETLTYLGQLRNYIGDAGFPASHAP